MILMGIGDEAGDALESQIAATRELGWRHLEARNVAVPGSPKANLHDLPAGAFDAAVGLLEESGVRVHCFGSTVMNWAKKISDPFEPTLAELERALARMRRLGTRYLRIMSYRPGDDEDRIPAEVHRRVGEVTRICLDAGVQPLHENCMNYGGMSPRHALELLEAVPGLKWVFDTANPVFNPDRSQPRPWPRQDAWEFWTQVRDHVEHIHIKDARWDAGRRDADYTWPGEGDGCVRRILADAAARGYDGGVSIEPHMVVVYHGAPTQADPAAQRANYVEYGRRLMRLIEEIRT